MAATSLLPAALPDRVAQRRAAVPAAVEDAYATAGERPLRRLDLALAFLNAEVAAGEAAAIVGVPAYDPRAPAGRPALLCP